MNSLNICITMLDFMTYFNGKFSNFSYTLDDFIFSDTKVYIHPKDCDCKANNKVCSRVELDKLYASSFVIKNRNI